MRLLVDYIPGIVNHIITTGNWLETVKCENKGEGKMGDTNTVWTWYTEIKVANAEQIIFTNANELFICQSQNQRRTPISWTKITARETKMWLWRVCWWE